MGQNPGQIRKALTAYLYAYPIVGGTLPDLPESGSDHAWDPTDHDFVDLGRTSLGSPPGQSYEPDTSDVRSHQSYYPDRSDTTSVSSALTFVLLQTNADTLKVAFGGGTATAAGGGTMYVPPEPYEIGEWSFILKTVDGDYEQLNVFPRTRPTLSSGVTFPREGDTPVQYEISATVLNPPGAVKPWYLVATGDLTDVGS